MNLRLAEGGFLLLAFDDFSGVAAHRRVDPSDICVRSDGTYAHGAPHPAKLRQRPDLTNTEVDREG